MRTLLLLLLLTLSTAVSAQRDNTGRGRLRLDKEATAAPAAPVDTLTGAALDSLLLSGYDKPLRSTRESIFAINRTGRDLSSVTFTIIYLDMAGRQLHSATHTIAADLPAGTTRLLDFRSWDLQQAFYYHLSRRPRSGQATPYRVDWTVTGATSTRTEQ